MIHYFFLCGETFTSQNTQKTFPVGVYSVSVRGGNGGNSDKNLPGGKGGGVKAKMRVMYPNQYFYIYVGGNANGAEGGYNGGGGYSHESSTTTYQGGGGGASEIRVDHDTFADRVLVAGGGSGATSTCRGAPGGDVNSRKITGGDCALEIGSANQNSGGNENGIGSSGVGSGSGGGGGWRGGCAISGAVAESGNSFVNVNNTRIAFEEIAYSVDSDGSPFVEVTKLFECPQNCQLCNSDSTCAKCLNGYFLTDGTRCVLNCPDGYNSFSGKCVKCGVTNCASCSADNFCNKCNNNLFAENGVCVLNCGAGYYQQGDQCIKCSQNCGKCDASGCLECSTGYLEGTVCVAACSSGTYPDSSLKKCQKCKTECSTCSDSASCNSCIPDYGLMNNQCLLGCPDGYYLSSGYCRACISNCKKCPGSDSCTECNTPFLLHNGKCTQNCPSHYFAKDGKCVQCDSSCLECSDADSCTSCSAGSFLHQGTCLGTCPAKYYGKDGVCVPCGANCETCNSDACLTCSPENYLFEGTCSQTCPPKHYPQSGKCEQCGANCNDCSGVLSCTSCEAGFYLSQGQCHSACPGGTYPDQSNVGTCKACPVGCKECTNDATCSSCTKNYFLSGSQCVQSCPTGTYGDQAQLKCIKCSPGTFSPGNLVDSCVMCNEGTVSIEGAGNCTECDRNQFETDRTSCIACSENCATCKYSDANCTSCQNPEYLYLSQCFPTCPEGTFASSTSVNLNARYWGVNSNNQRRYSNEISVLTETDMKTCENCSDPCLGCIESKDKCTSCTENYYFYSNICYTEEECLNLRADGGRVQFLPNKENRTCVKGGTNAFSNERLFDSPYELILLIFSIGHLFYIPMYTRQF